MNPFIDIKENELENITPSGTSYGNFKEMAIGQGSKVFRGDDQGVWLGAAKFADAPFKVDMDGDLVATSATISGAISASTIDIGGADATSFHVDVDGNMWAGAAAFASAPFKVSNAGALIAKSVSILDSSDGGIVDASGIVSTTQFTASSVQGSGTQSTNEDSFQDATGVTITFTLSRTENVFIFATVSAGTLTGDAWLNMGYCSVRVLVDAAQVGTGMACPGREFISGLAYTSAATSEVVSLASGSHTAKVQFCTSDTDYDSYISKSNCIIGYVILGK